MSFHCKRNFYGLYWLYFHLTKQKLKVRCRYLYDICAILYTNIYSFLSTINDYEPFIKFILEEENKDQNC